MTWVSGKRCRCARAPSLSPLPPHLRPLTPPLPPAHRTQSIALLWTVLRQGITPRAPTVRRALIVCPTTLVNNWKNELTKWCGERIRSLALAEVTHDEAARDIGTFLSGFQFPVMIISYETFRIHSKKFHAKDDAVDLLICDEAHRLKNDATLTNKALAALACRRRVLLSGTPMQNDLDEFFAMVDFTNPGVLGDERAFRRNYSSPILTGREPTATDQEKAAGDAASAELSTTVNRFILRRTNTLLTKFLPPKCVQIVSVRCSPLQRTLYNHFLASKTVSALLAGKQTGVLASITALRKLINHPKLVADVIRQKQSAGAGARAGEAAGFDDCAHLFPQGMFSDRNALFTETGGKFALTARLLAHLRASTRDRIVIVSVFTQTLDLFSTLCRDKSWPFIRLDGSTGAGKRQKMVDQFNDQARDEFVFLLSSKAGGCGLNLIGGNRLILFDPDWNPATDLQASARVWRDGQRKRTYVYRFLAAGTLEEKVFQRQLSKCVIRAGRSGSAGKG
jgi:DNA repair and recombination RAD54-like protein